MITMFKAKNAHCIRHNTIVLFVSVIFDDYGRTPNDFKANYDSLCDY